MNENENQPASHHRPPESVAPTDPGFANRKKRPPMPSSSNVTLTPSEFERLGKSLIEPLEKIQKALRVMQALDVIAKELGGWPQAFEFVKQAKRNGYPLILYRDDYMELHPDVVLDLGKQ